MIFAGTTLRYLGYYVCPYNYLLVSHFHNNDTSLNRITIWPLH